MSRIFTVNFGAGTGVTLGGAQDLWEIVNTATPKFIQLLRIKIGCPDVTLAVGQMIDYQVRLFSGATITAGTGGTLGATINKSDPGDPAAVGFTANTNQTTPATTTGTNTLLMEDSFHIFNGLDESFNADPANPDGSQPFFVPAAATATTQAIIVKAMNAPSGTVHLAGTAWILERG
jgi:hypothetical protein